MIYMCVYSLAAVLLLIRSCYVIATLLIAHSALAPSCEHEEIDLDLHFTPSSSTTFNADNGLRRTRTGPAPCA